MCVMIIITIYIFIQKLNTTNECVVSVLGGISSTAHQVPTVTPLMILCLQVVPSTQLCGFLESNSEVLSASLDQSSPNSTENEVTIPGFHYSEY